MDLDSEKVFEMAYEREGIYFVDQGEVIAKKCPRCEKVKFKEFFSSNPNRRGGISSHCLKCIYAWHKANPHVVTFHQHKRRAIEKALDSSFTRKEVDETVKRFGDKCALTGKDWSWDHVIPLTLGREGTTKNNMVPLNLDLNLSKNRKNIFEWFSVEKERFNLNQTKFDELIEYLAELNGMTPKEYRDYVYWCHENPRELAQ